MSSIEILRQLLTQLRTADTDLSIGEARFHRYQLNPCLTEDEVQAFERRSNVILPDDYRQFLLQVGNGGAGPGCGMLKFVWKDWGEAIAIGKSYENGTFPNQIPVYFLLEKEELTGGITLPLADYGCGMTAQLVVTGKRWGKVWFISAENDTLPFGQGLCNHLHAGSAEEFMMEVEEAFSFYEWYRDWLVNSLAELEVNV